jgi:biopolymer transport protein ExbD
MAQLDLSRRHQSTSLSHRVRLNVDLTPMVDLGFLLITFFILTTTLSQPKSTNLIMPKDSTEKILLKESVVLTLRPVRNNSIDYFEGRNESVENVKHCSYSELRSVIQQKQNEVEKILGNKNESVVIIDPSSESSYKNFVDVMDEIQINDIGHYFVVSHQQ